jgi:hypothetical protein
LLDDIYYISAILINTRDNYFDVFRDIVNRHLIGNSKELKFKKMAPDNRIAFLNDLNNYRQQIFIYVESAQQLPPIFIIRNILNNYPSNNVERIIIIDENLLPPSEILQLKTQDIIIIMKKSFKVPGIQIADIIAGSYRKYDMQEDLELLSIVLNKLCKVSINNIIPRR